ncbi:RNI-like protein [Dacryopinax primogenitus]|uniref:RNI-like protein n=1 Tax=Dacryopinax primogenitus (strain DJM 731) TaxID=1858805 RepID=M5GDH3_DACPD|nr:RNI-like protein [Dacryopinax primogenitus]EJU04532.1 RNI-like protein [Dacryopinax primogenitus]
MSMARFAQHVVRLSQDEFTQNRAMKRLADLPTHLVQPLFEFLRHYCPTRLSGEFITKYFLRGDHLVFSNDMTGVLNGTVKSFASAPGFATSLKTLELRGQTDLKDNVVAATLRHLPALISLVLRGCTQVGSRSVEAVAETCHDLEMINLNYTVTRHAAIRKLVNSCKKLHSIKVAGLRDITDTHFSQILSDVSGRLRQLKVRQTDLTQTSAAVISNALSANAVALDISFTSMVLTELPPNLEKLSLTATPILAAPLLRLLTPLKKLRKLSLAYLGGDVASLSDDGLKLLLPALNACERLVDLNLALNNSLGLNGSGGASALLAIMGSRLEVLNLSGISRMRWYDLEPLKALLEPPPLRQLVLTNTGLDDRAALYISACRHLRMLSLGGTGLSSEGVDRIVDACKDLQELDLTGCRGVRIYDRRHFFESWAARKRDAGEEDSSTE